MEIDEFLAKAKDSDSALAGELDQLRTKLGLKKLYPFGFLVNADDALVGIVWGARKSGDQLDEALLKQELVKFLKDHVATDDSELEMKILYTPLEEVDHVLDLALRPYVQGHGGTLDVLSVDEERGEVEVSLEGVCSSCSQSMATMDMGVRRALHELPWVKKVTHPNEPEDPDFEVPEVGGGPGGR